VCNREQTGQEAGGNLGPVRLMTRAGALGVYFSLLVAAPTPAQVILVYGQSAGSRVDRIDVSEEVLPDRAVQVISVTSGETYRIESDDAWRVNACEFEYSSGDTSWAARRDGNSLRLDGIVQGRAVHRTFAIDEHPWYESVEQSLQAYALSGSPRPRLFWIVEPYGGNAYLMTGRIEGREVIEVNGSPVDAVRLVVRPAGVLSFIWSSTNWFSARDGTFLKSESVRGVLPFTPTTVVELQEDRRGP